MKVQTEAEKVIAEGKAAASHGKPKKYNPYPKNSPDYLLWLEGWEDEVDAEEGLDSEYDDGRDSIDPRFSEYN